MYTCGRVDGDFVARAGTGMQVTLSQVSAWAWHDDVVVTNSMRG